LEGGIDSADDLMELGLSKIKAKTLFNKIRDWKVSGLMGDFIVPLPTVGESRTAAPTPRFAQEPESYTAPELSDTAMDVAATSL